MEFTITTAPGPGWSGHHHLDVPAGSEVSFLSPMGGCRRVQLAPDISTVRVPSAWLIAPVGDDVGLIEALEDLVDRLDGAGPAHLILWSVGNTKGPRQILVGGVRVLGP